MCKLRRSFLVVTVEHEQPTASGSFFTTRSMKPVCECQSCAKFYDTSEFWSCLCLFEPKWRKMLLRAALSANGADRTSNLEGRWHCRQRTQQQVSGPQLWFLRSSRTTALWALNATYFTQVCLIGQMCQGSLWALEDGWIMRSYWEQRGVKDWAAYCCWCRWREKGPNCLTPLSLL